MSDEEKHYLDLFDQFDFVESELNDRSYWSPIHDVERAKRWDQLNPKKKSVYHIDSSKFILQKNFKLKPKVRDAALDHMCVIFINDSAEGHHHPEKYERIKKFIRDSGIPAKSVIYTNSNLLEQQCFQNWCYVTGNSEPWYSNGQPWFWASCDYWKKYDVDHNFNKKKYTVLSYNRTWGAMRTAMMYKIYRKPWFKDSLVSFSKYDPMFTEPRSEDEEIEGLENHFQSALLGKYLESYDEKGFNHFRSKLPFVIDREDMSYNFAFEVHKQHFEESWISLIAETDLMVASNFWNGIFFSEKIFRSIALAHPFIVWGRPTYLHYLQQHGFQLYDPIIPSDYDSIECGYERLNRIVEVLDNLDNSRLKELYEISDYNREVYRRKDTRFFALDIYNHMRNFFNGNF